MRIKAMPPPRLTLCRVKIRENLICRYGGIGRRAWFSQRPLGELAKRGHSPAKLCGLSKTLHLGHSDRVKCTEKKLNMRIWRNWQTRMVQVHVKAISCRFKSCYPHHKKPDFIGLFVILQTILQLSDASPV